MSDGNAHHSASQGGRSVSDCMKNIAKVKYTGASFFSHESHSSESHRKFKEKYLYKSVFIVLFLIYYSVLSCSQGECICEI